MGGVCAKTPQDEDGGTRAQPAEAERTVLRTTGVADLPAVSKIMRGDLHSQYIFGSKVLGTGFSGPVRLAINRRTGWKYAVKTFSKHGAKLDRVSLLRNEAQIYLRLDHPNIARLIEVWEDECFVHLVMELCSGGELYERLCRRKVYSEADTRNVTTQMLAAIQYLHAHNIVHRDIKLENWLYQGPEEASNLKLIDFGFSKLWNPKVSSRMHATCGTLAYVSPDTLLGGYTNACDLWSLGVIVYMLLVGYPPFYGTEEEIFESILEGSYSAMDGPRWERVSAGAQDFVRRLLEADPGKRLTGKDALEHPWIRSGVVRADAPIHNSVLISMKRYAESEHLKRAALTMMAYSLSSDQIRGFREIFLAFDKSKEGTIRLHELADVMKSRMEISNEEIDYIFNSMDSSGDQELHYNDFLAAMLLTRIHMHEHLIRESFRKFDTDGTGYISLENLRDILGSTYHDSFLQEAFKEADINNTGGIDYEEFLQLIRRGDAAPFLDEAQSLETNASGKTESEIQMAFLSAVDRAAVSQPTTDDVKTMVQMKSQG